MRIYKRSEFMKLPAGTLFASTFEKYDLNPPKYWCFGFNFEGLYVKGETLESPSGDWHERCLLTIQSHDYDEMRNRYEKMYANNESFPMNDSICRNGFYNDDSEIFLVYEKEDLLALKEIIETALEN